MLVKECLQCGKPFEVVKKKHYFCKTKCKRKYYYIHIENAKDFPAFLCQYCGNLTKLSFHPKKNLDKWSKFSCPICKKKRPD